MNCCKCGDRKVSEFRKLPDELKPFVTLDSKRGDPVVCAACWPKVKQLNPTLQTPTRSSPTDTSSTPSCTFTPTPTRRPSGANTPQPNPSSLNAPCDGSGRTLQGIRFVPNDNHVLTEINTIRRFCLGKPVLIQGCHVCGPCRKECIKMRRAMDAICRRAGEPEELPRSSQLPAPCVTTPTSPGMGLRTSAKRKLSEP